jgi:hypothetical protein
MESNSGTRALGRNRPNRSGFDREAKASKVCSRPEMAGANAVVARRDLKFRS